MREKYGLRSAAACSRTDTVDYVHRTTAEYLAAEWLAERIRAGLSVGRVRSLVGIEGHPASELRGLHAWLPIFLPEYAELFIDADPYGALTYGDAASLTPSSRRRLLEALARLSETDPWFRRGNWSSARLGGLSGPEMVNPFRAVLGAPSSNFALRSIVLDALADGTSLPTLMDDLIAVLVRSGGPYAERCQALAALLNMGEAGKKAIVQAYREQLGSDAPATRLRAEIISAIYGDPFGPSDVAALLASLLACTEALPAGALSLLPRGIPLEDIPAILDSFEPAERRAPPSRSGHRNAYHVTNVIDRLLLRVLEETEDISTSKLWKWLRARLAFRDRYGGGRSDEIRQALRQRSNLLLAMVDEAVGGLTVHGAALGFLHQFQEATLRAIDDDDLLERLATHITKAKGGSDKEVFLYELALLMSRSGSPRAIKVFECLYSLGDQRPDTPTYGTRQKRNLTDFTRAIRTLPALVCMAFFGSAANGLAGYLLLQVGNPVRDRRLRWKLCFER